MKDELASIANKLDEDFAKLPSDLLDSLRKRFEQNSYSVILDAQLATYNRLFRNLKAKTCAKASIIMICGGGSTNSEGLATIPIIFCGVSKPNNRLVIIDVPCFLATPSGQSPTVISATIKSTIAQSVGLQFVRLDEPRADRMEWLDDVSAEVRAWQLDGQPAAGAEFLWSCTVEVAELETVS